MSRKDKIAGIIKNRKQLWPAVNLLLYNKTQDEVLKKFGIESLPGVNPKDFFEHYGEQHKSFSILSDFSDGISPVNDYYFLCRLAKCLKIENYFEIGTWLGLSARNISDTMGEQVSVYSLDIPFDHPEMQIFDIPKEVFGYYAKDRKNVNFLKSDSKEFDFAPYAGRMDLVFIDGNHSMEYVESDTRNGLRLLRNDTSILVWHDYMILGDINKEVLCGILNGIPKADRKYLYYLRQSNMAVYSRSFNFRIKEQKKWEISGTSYKVNITEE